MLSITQLNLPGLPSRISRIGCCCKESYSEKRLALFKKRKWKGDYVAYGFHRTKEEILNPYPSVHCLFCRNVFGNSNLSPGHLKKHLESQHPCHQNKSKAFFEASIENHCRQLSSWEYSVVKEGNNDLALASLKMSHMLMQRIYSSPLS